MISWKKENDFVFLFIDSSYYRDCDIIIENFFYLKDNKIIITDFNGVCLIKEKINQNIQEYLLEKKELTCFFKLKNKLFYNIERKLKLKE